MFYIALLHRDGDYLTLHLRRPNNVTIIETVIVFLPDLKLIRYNSESKRLELCVGIHRIEVCDDALHYLKIQEMIGVNIPFPTLENDTL